MGYGHSLDLRQRIIEAARSGSSARAAARRFGVSASSAMNLVARVRNTGSYAPGPVGGQQRRTLAGHEAWLRVVVGSGTVGGWDGAEVERGGGDGHVVEREAAQARGVLGPIDQVVAIGRGHELQLRQIAQHIGRGNLIVAPPRGLHLPRSTLIP